MDTVADPYGLLSDPKRPFRCGMTYPEYKTSDTHQGFFIVRELMARNEQKNPRPASNSTFDDVRFL